MATLASQLQPISVTPGVQPVTDRTRFDTPHYTYSDKIRSWRGSLQKIGGWLSVAFEYGMTIMGVARSLYSAIIQELQATVIGTSSYLYALYGNVLTNISPLETTTHAIANSIATNFGTLANNPVHTTIGTGNLTIDDTSASRYQVGDIYTLSGATTTNSILNTAINTLHIIRTLGVNSVGITVSGTASATGAGGGASVVRATGLLRLTAATNGISNGWRVKIAGAANTGGILAADINQEFIARNVAVGTFDVMTDGTATSSVSAGGGAATTYQKQIAAGNENESYGVGYGMGLYGAGLYGVAKTSTGGKQLPRIWFFDRFGDVIIGTPGNSSGVYNWDGSTSVAPALISGAPDDVNYAFVSDNILVTFGHDDLPNQIFASDQGDPTQWTASSTNQVFQDIIEGAGKLLSHVPVLGVNLIFSNNQTYRFSYIGLPNIWEIKLLDNSIGIIGAMARCSVNNVAYWMSLNNFYRWSGGNVEIIPANTQDQCTALEYVFGNINTSQLSKCFAWYNPRYNEVWFHYPSANSNECDSYITVSIADGVWMIGTLARSCAEYPSNLWNFPRMISPTGTFYNHEQGFDDDTSPMEFTLRSNLRSSSKFAEVKPGLVPDSLQDGTITVNFKGYMFPQSTATLYDKTYDVTGTTEKIETLQAGRFWQYEWSGDELGQNWNMGQWLEYTQGGAAN